jgi:hypothetical protein
MSIHSLRWRYCSDVLIHVLLYSENHDWSWNIIEANDTVRSSIFILCVMCFSLSQSFNDILLYILQNCQMEESCETQDVEVLVLSQYTCLCVGYVINMHQDCVLFFIILQIVWLSLVLYVLPVLVFIAIICKLYTWECEIWYEIVCVCVHLVWLLKLRNTDIN